MNDRCELMQQVYETGFAVTEAALYLDTHPCDAEAIRYFEMARGSYKTAVKDYTSRFGPLNYRTVRFVETENDGCGCQDDGYGQECFNWVKEPWPWEGGMY